MPVSGLLEQRLKAIIDDSSAIIEDSPYQAAVEVAAEIAGLKSKLALLENRLANAIDRFSGGLALGIRNSQPGLNVALIKGKGCKVGYRSKSLSFYPDLTNKAWVVESLDPQFCRRFRQTCSSVLGLTTDLTGTANAIAGYFNEHYKSLGEAIYGEGIVLYEQRRVTYGQFVELVQNADKLLREVEFET